VDALRVAEEVAQALERGLGRRRLADHEPEHGVERVQEEVRVELGPERVELGAGPERLRARRPLGLGAQPRRVEERVGDARERRVHEEAREELEGNDAHLEPRGRERALHPRPVEREEEDLADGREHREGRGQTGVEGEEASAARLGPGEAARRPERERPEQGVGQHVGERPAHRETRPHRARGEEDDDVGRDVGEPCRGVEQYGGRPPAAWALGPPVRMLAKRRARRRH
jgi:hypothetical protein